MFCSWHLWSPPNPPEAQPSGLSSSFQEHLNVLEVISDLVWKSMKRCGVQVLQIPAVRKLYFLEIKGFMKTPLNECRGTFAARLWILRASRICLSWFQRSSGTPWSSGCNPSRLRLCSRGSSQELLRGGRVGSADSADRADSASSSADSASSNKETKTPQKRQEMKNK